MPAPGSICGGFRQEWMARDDLNVLDNTSLRVEHRSQVYLSFDPSLPGQWRIFRKLILRQFGWY